MHLKIWDARQSGADIMMETKNQKGVRKSVDLSFIIQKKTSPVRLWEISEQNILPDSRRKNGKANIEQMKSFLVGYKKNTCFGFQVI